MKNILIIGGAGYIGSELFDRMGNFYNVDSIDLEWHGESPHRNTKKDYATLKRVHVEGYDAVILLAAYASVQLCERMGSYYVFGNDVAPFTRLINLLKENKKTKFIYASTGSVYGKNGLCREEDVDYKVSNAYDLSKRTNDEYAMLNIKDVEIYGLRFGTLSGWSPHLRNDIMLNSMYYSAYDRGYISLSEDCESQFRSVLDIQDACKAIHAIVEGGQDQRGIYNLASFGGTIGAIARDAAAVLGCKIKMVKGQSPYSFVLNCNKFKRAFPYINLQGSVGSILSSLNKKPMLTTDRR